MSGLMILLEDRDGLNLLGGKCVFSFLLMELFQVIEKGKNNLAFAILLQLGDSTACVEKRTKIAAIVADSSSNLNCLKKDGRKFWLMRELMVGVRFIAVFLRLASNVGMLTLFLVLVDVARFPSTCFFVSFTYGSVFYRLLDVCRRPPRKTNHPFYSIGEY